MAASLFGRFALLAWILLGGQAAMALDIASLWNYSDPAASEQRFRQALAGASGDDALELQTQIARTYGLRQRFAEARQVLAGIEAAIPRAAAQPQVRYYLELAEASNYVSYQTLAELRLVHTHCARLVTALARGISDTR